LISVYTSYDGKQLTGAVRVSLSLGKNALIGFSVASGMRNSTTVVFDHTAVKKE
jgi:hypothetical protein